MVQTQISKQDSQLRSLHAERNALAAQLEDMQANLQTATSLAEQQVRECPPYSTAMSNQPRLF